MKVGNMLLCASICLVLGSLANATGTDDRLFYRRPAKIWEETLPLGNGRLGLMTDSGTRHEHITCGAAARPTTVILRRLPACLR